MRNARAKAAIDRAKGEAARSASAQHFGHRIHGGPAHGIEHAHEPQPPAIVTWLNKSASPEAGHAVVIRVLASRSGELPHLDIDGSSERAECRLDLIKPRRMIETKQTIN